MYSEHQPWRPLATADLDFGEDGAPRSRRYDDIYYSPDDGLAECRHVFLGGSDLPARWLGAAAGAFRVGELGFGTGLNFLATLEAFLATAAPSRRLHYWAVEHAPLGREDLQRCLECWPTLTPLAAPLIADYPPPVPGTHRLLFDGGRVVLDLCWADADAALEDLAAHRRAWFDAWYLDGFAPGRNPALWRSELWTRLARLSRPGATVATFSAAGAVRRGLDGAGFAMAKRPGFGRKRESLAGVLARRAPPESAGETPWDLSDAPPAAPATALVLGAGLAGASAAAALARRGVSVTVLDRGGVAGRGSGNAQGVLYTRLSHRHAPLTDFALLAYLDARRRYRALFESGLLEAGRDGELAGAFQLAGPKVRLEQLAPVLRDVPELAEILDPAAAAELLGTAPSSPGLWLPHSGWLHPPGVCRALLATPGIEVVTGCGDLTVRAELAGWTASTGDGRRWHGDLAVIAAGVDSLRLAELDWLPLRAIRGQVTALPADALPAPLRVPVCHTGYVAPAREGQLSAGATFAPGDRDLALRPRDHRDNLRALGAALPAFADALEALPADTLDGRAELRAASPDYLPLAGPAPDVAAFQERYAALARNARRPIDAAGVYRDGLYISTGHGSRGLTSSPLAGELIASHACDEPPPLPRTLLRALAPARFIIRAIARSDPAP